MDIATLIGLILGCVAMVLTVFTSGGSLLTYWDLPSIFCTMGGSFASLLINHKLQECLGIFQIMGRSLRTPNFRGKEMVKRLLEFSEKARKEGLLALEDDINDLPAEFDFLKRGLQHIVDGYDAEVIRNILENDISEMQGRHAKWTAVLLDWATLAPAFGMIGTVIGLIAMLKNLEDKSRVGPNMAVALITTLYGSIMANFIFLPMRGKLMAHDQDETAVKEMVIEGVLSIQAGDNPHILLQKLLTYFPPDERRLIEREYAA